MQILLHKLIGDEILFSPEHRIFNLILLIGIVLTVFSSIFNYYMALGIQITMICFLCSIALTCLYYVSIIKKQHSIPIVIFICICVFVMIPSIWIFNGGILGGAPLVILMTVSAIASLLRGFNRLTLFICLVLVTLSLIIFEYKNPLLITGYTSDVERYIDVSFSLLCTMLANVSFLIIVMNYYNKEYKRSKDYLIEIEKQKTDNAMKRLEGLNLIGEMAASIGHEIRNPLTTVRGFLQYFSMKKTFLDYEDDFNLMIQELDRANLIITEFLSLAKNKKISLESNNLNIIISKIYPLMQANAACLGRNILLELGEIPQILMDENEIKQYILNLVRNGLEATQYNGVVSIKTYMDNENVILEIQDNGNGIPQEVLDKIGTPFVTTKNTGTGMGIPICFRIAERHNALLNIKTSSSGTTFFMKFILI